MARRPSRMERLRQTVGIAPPNTISPAIFHEPQTDVCEDCPDNGDHCATCDDTGQVISTDLAA